MVTRGIIRNLDMLGRYCIPKEYLISMGIGPGTALEFYEDDDRGRIVMKVYSGGTCVFCSEFHEKIMLFKEKHVCKNCFDEASSIMSGLAEVASTKEDI